MDQWTALMVGLAVEVPVVMALAWLLRWAHGAELGWLGLLSLSVTCLTQPAMWALLEAASPGVPATLVGLVAWGGVALAHGLVFARVVPLGRRKGVVLAAAGNVAVVLTSLMQTA